MIEIFQLRRRSHPKVFSSLGFSLVAGCVGQRAIFRLGFAVVALIALTGQAQTQPLLMTKIVTVPSSAIVTGNGLVMVNWNGGTAPFQVECSTGFGGNWQDVDGITYGFSQTNILTAPTAFYRVAGVAATIAASPDKTAPSVPTGLAPTTASSTQVNLTWNASVDGGTNASGVKGYNVYRNGIFLKQVAAPGTSAADTDLTPLTTNNYAVSAVDNAYNQSARSSSASASTPASGNCAFIISPLNAAFPSADSGSNLTVTAGAGCSWTAISGASWITITSGASGTGNGTVGFSVSANTNFSIRTGTMTVAAQTVTVTQAAAADTTAPTVSLTTPASGSTVSNTISLAASASDKVGVTKVVFYRDGTTLVGTATAAPFSVSDNTTSVSNGLHSYCARAYDAATNSTLSASSSVTVSNAAAPPPTGTCLWSRHFGGSTVNAGGASPASIREDKNGNVVVVGGFSGSVDFGGGTVASTNGQEMFIVKYDASGTYLWSRQISSSGGNQATGVAVDSNNNLVVVGWFAGTIDFGAGPLSSAGSWDIFVAKFAPDGTLVWAKRFGGSAWESFSTVALDASNNIFITGFYGFTGTTIDFGGGPLPLPGGDSNFQNNMFVAKLDSSGNYIWAKGYAGSGDIQGNGIAVDGNGDVAVAGSFQQTVNFGGASFTSAGNYDMFVAKYSGATGNHLWSLSGGGSGYDFGNAIAFDSNGNVVVTGEFYGTANIGGNTLSSPYNTGLPAMFLAKFSSTGTALWSRGFAPSFSGGEASGNGVAVDGAGNIVVTGFVSGDTAFDGK
jgi:Bacterial Ig domain/Putative binding domain, N-terminal